MLTYISVRCPICCCSLNVRRAYLGKTVACRYCDQVFVIRLGDERLTVQVTEPSDTPPRGPGVDTGLAVLGTGASDDWSSLVIDVRGVWDPEADRYLEVTRTEDGPSSPGVGVVHVDLARPSPGVVVVFAAELERLRGELATAGSERDRLWDQVERLQEQRQADAVQQRRLHEEIEASREARERLDAERHAALDAVDQYEVAVDKLGRSLRDAQSRHDAACSALARESTLREQLERECAALRGQVEEQRNRTETGLRALDLTAAQLASALRQRDHLTATGAALRQQVHALESTLDTTQEEAEAARDEARRGHEDLIHLRHALELAERREQGATAENNRLSTAAVAVQNQLRALELALSESREEAETARDEARHGHEELIHLRHMLELADRREQSVAEEKNGLSATGAELRQQLRALESALSAAREEAESARDEVQCGQEDLIHLRHTLELAERREQAALLENKGLSATALELRQQLCALESALSDVREEAETAREEARCRQEDLIHLCHTLELADRREQAVAAENHGLSATGAELQQQLCALESALNDVRKEAETAREEARCRHEELIHLRQTLELAERCEQAVAAENRGLSATGAELQQQIRALESALSAVGGEAEEAREGVRREHQELIQLRDELRALRHENDLSRSEAELLRRDRDLARSELQGLVQNQELLAQTLALVEAAYDMVQEQSRAERARSDAALAEAEGRNKASADRSDELYQELVELRAELDRLRMEPSAPPTNGRAHTAEAAGRPWLDEGWTTHRGSECYRGTLYSSLSQNQDSRAISERPLMLNSGTSAHSVYLPEESPSREFPSDVDLGVVRAQVELLNGLLSTEQSSGRVLIYQQRLAEFSQRIREASRLATNLANEVEQSRRRDEMQFHMYLVRRAEEIEKPRA